MCVSVFLCLHGSALSSSAAVSAADAVSACSSGSGSVGDERASMHVSFIVCVHGSVCVRRCR